MKVPTQFNLRALALLTIASAGLLAAVTQAGPVGAFVAGMLCITAGSLAGRPGVVSGAASGVSYATLGLIAAAAGFPQLVWPAQGVLFLTWWLATGVLLGAILGSLVAPRAGEWRPVAPLSWFASAHLHVIVGTLLSVTAVGLSGHLPGGGRASLEASEPGAEVLASWGLAPAEEEEPCEEELLEEEPWTNVMDGVLTEEVVLGHRNDGVPPPRPALEVPERLDDLAARWQPKVFCPRETIAARATQLVDPARRGEALTWLLGSHASIVPTLKELRSQASPELRQEIDVVLGSFQAETGSGGLTVTLLADRAVVKPGDKVAFTTVLRNTLDEPLNVCLGRGHSVADNRFESGWALASPLGGDHPPQRPVSVVGRCGNGVGPICATIPANGALTFRMMVTFQAAPPIYNSYLLPGKDAYLRMLGPVHNLVVLVHGDSRDYEPEKGGLMFVTGRRRHGVVDPNARNWTGELRSNEVILREAP